MPSDSTGTIEDRGTIGNRVTKRERYYCKVPVRPRDCTDPIESSDTAGTIAIRCEPTKEEIAEVFSR